MTVVCAPTRILPPGYFYEKKLTGMVERKVRIENPCSFTLHQAPKEMKSPIPIPSQNPIFPFSLLLVCFESESVKLNDVEKMFISFTFLGKYPPI
jgi:hypothetical protein